MYHENSGNNGYHYHVKFNEPVKDNTQLNSEPNKVLDKSKLPKPKATVTESKLPVQNTSKQVFEQAKKSNLIKKEPVKKQTTVEEPSFFDNFLEKSKKVFTYMTSDVPISETLKVKDAADGNPTEDKKATVVNKTYSVKPKLLPVKTENVEDLKKDFQFEKSLGFNKPDVSSKVSKGSSYQNLNLGTYSRNIVDMSNGITVTYQPRNEKNKDRKDVNNALFISDYLYDMDFTDGYKHEDAQTSLNKLKQRWLDKNYEQKFVQVREPLGNNKYKVQVKPVKNLTDKDFKNDNIYRQSYAKLSDFDITPDGSKIKLIPYSKLWNAALFQNQGLPFMDKNNYEHGLRLPGGKGNYGKYQNINDLDQYGAYLGATVTIVSDDGKIVKKVSGSVKDIINMALYIKNKTGGKEVHFLQSDAGSMNIKADANNNKITSKQMGIARNQEPQAGATEILLNE